MPQVINTNIASLNTQRNLNMSQAAQGVAIQRLSSGLRINSAKDDAAGLAISERFTAQIRGLNQAVRNANDGVSLAQTAEGALGQMGNALQRIRELAVQSANATNSASDRAALQAEVSQLVGEITRIGNSTSFNGLKILDGSYTNQQYQVGANAQETISISVADSRASKLGASVKASTAGISTTGLDLTTGVTINSQAIATTGATSMQDVINFINGASTSTGVSASRATSNTLTVDFDGTNAGSVTLNGVQVAVNAGMTKAQFVDAVNAVSSQTGVTVAAGAAAAVTFTSAGAADFSILEGAGTNLSVVGTTATTYTAGIQLAGKLGASLTVAGTLNTTLSVAASATDYQVSTVDVTSIANANNALQTVDFALTQVNSARATLGAVQSRFQAVTESLQTAGENLTASRSRVMDADFAAETANLTRAQILQQAGVAMLAQANALPQNVLALLRG